MNKKTLLDFDSHSLATELKDKQPLLLERVSIALGSDTVAAEAALGELLRFLALVAESKTPLTPSQKIDLAWHEFILFTRTYETFCKNHFGEFIHHTPGGSVEQNNHQYRKTLVAYQSKFGNPSIQFWDNPDLGPAASECGSCEAS